MTKQELKEVEKIVNLLTDKNVGKLVESMQIEGKDEEFGAMVAYGVAFDKAYKIYKRLDINS